MNQIVSPERLNECYRNGIEALMEEDFQKGIQLLEYYRNYAHGPIDQEIDVLTMLLAAYSNVGDQEKVNQMCDIIDKQPYIPEEIKQVVTKMRVINEIYIPFKKKTDKLFNSIKQEVKGNKVHHLKNPKDLLETELFDFEAITRLFGEKDYIIYLIGAVLSNQASTEECKSFLQKRAFVNRSLASILGQLKDNQDLEILEIKTLSLIMGMPQLLMLVPQKGIRKIFSTKLSEESAMYLDFILMKYLDLVVGISGRDISIDYRGVEVNAQTYLEVNQIINDITVLISEEQMYDDLNIYPIRSVIESCILYYYINVSQEAAGDYVLATMIRMHELLTGKKLKLEVDTKLNKDIIDRFGSVLAKIFIDEK